MGVGSLPAIRPNLRRVRVRSIERVTDEELVLLARQGDPDAFDQLVARHQAAVFRAASGGTAGAGRRGGSGAGCVRSRLGGAGRFRGDSSFRTWILRIVWNRAISRRRGLASWLRRATPIDDVAEPVAVAAGQHVGDAERGTAGARSETRSRHWRRSCVTRCCWRRAASITYDEIARMLGIPVGTVKWRVSEARRKVREQLAALGYVHAK